MCVAGIDLDTHLHVRPVLDRNLPIDLLAIHGGPFDIGRVIDLGETCFVGKVPEVEDQWFDVNAARHVADMPEQEFWDLIETRATRKLGSIFGSDLQLLGSTCVVLETYGLRSLGCYWAIDGCLFCDDEPSHRRVRFPFQSGAYAFTVPVTDLRLYGDDHVTPCKETIDRLAAQIAMMPRVLVGVGLSRPYRRSADEPSRHWLQVNNFHLPEHPCWQLMDHLS